MRRTIIINEEQARNLLSLRLNEMTGDVQIGREIYTAKNLNALKSIPNNAFTNPLLDEAYIEWANSDHDSASDEYYNFCKSMKHFMRTLDGLIASIENKKNRRVPFNCLILDPQWMRLAIQGIDNFRSTEGNEGRNSGFRCLYTFILTIYQNTAAWNDYCFNPEFEKYRAFVSNLVGQAINLDPSYKQIMPLKELREINAFKANKANEKPELFYNDDYRINVIAQKEAEATGEDDFD